jgi:hypothetical protein
VHHRRISTCQHFNGIKTTKKEKQQNAQDDLNHKVLFISKLGKRFAPEEVLQNATLIRRETTLRRHHSDAIRAVGCQPKMQDIVLRQPALDHGMVDHIGSLLQDRHIHRCQDVCQKMTQKRKKRTLASINSTTNSLSVQLTINNNATGFGKWHE